MEAPRPLADLSLRRLLEELSSDSPAPGGSLAAVVAALAAGLVAMVARSSPGWRESSGVLAQAQSLKERLLPLAEADAIAYAEALAALRLPPTLETEVRNEAIRVALERAAEVPLVIAAAAADVALLAEHTAACGEPAIRGDATVAVTLAAAAARSAAHLVAINLDAYEGDRRVQEAERLADAAEEASRRALAAGVHES